MLIKEALDPTPKKKSRYLLSINYINNKIRSILKELIYF